MEKQLLFLLDWDLRINPEDLYYHLEPFLAPIRVWQARQAEKARMIEQEKEYARQQQYQLTAENLSSYEYASYAPRQQQKYAYHSSSRAASRTPSLSPPTRSARSASTSTSSSPSSFHDEPAEAIMHSYDQGASIVHINAPVTQTKLQHSLPIYEDNKPAKKTKTSGGFFNRMFAGAYASRTAAY
jgi:G1/S-specific cyclin PLC1